MTVSDDIHVVDSFSSDKTIDIVRRLGVHITQHPFQDYSAQRNWAIENLRLKCEWQLHLDADERLSEELAAEINNLNVPEEINGFFIPRQVIFLGRKIIHGGMYPIWHMRLFRTGTAHCEDRRYDQHFIVSGRTMRLSSPLFDDHKNSLSDWTDRHNRWSDAEAAEIFSGSESGAIAGRLIGNPIERKRFAKNGYYRFPLFIRSAFLFFYRYIFRFGFLDGSEGLIFFSLQTLWFRFLVDAKYYELKLKAKSKAVV